MYLLVKYVQQTSDLIEYILLTTEHTPNKLYKNNNNNDTVGIIIDT